MLRIVAWVDFLSVALCVSNQSRRVSSAGSGASWPWFARSPERVNRSARCTAVARSSAVEQMRQKAEGYGMPNAGVDGMQLLEVHQAAEEALEHVRHKGPFFLEAATYRFMGHSMGDPERYRSGEEITQWRENDPIGFFRKHLLEIKGVGEKTLEAEEARAQDQVDAALRFAEESPEPTLETLLGMVYAGKEA